jgi:hypothetical protein
MVEMLCLGGDGVVMWGGDGEREGNKLGHENLLQ